MPITKIIDPKLHKSLFGDNWPIRRRWMLWTLTGIFANCEALIMWVIFTGGNALGVQIFLALLSAGMSLLMFYVGGAVWDDHNKRKALAWAPRADDEDCENGPGDENASLEDTLKTPREELGKE